MYQCTCVTNYLRLKLLKRTFETPALIFQKLTHVYVFLSEVVQRCVFFLVLYNSEGRHRKGSGLFANALGSTWEENRVAFVALFHDVREVMQASE
jgi:hypothetical protein